MVCNVAIQYTYQLSIADFREEVEKPLCLKAARFVVHHLRADIDKEFVGVKDKFKQLVYKQMERELTYSIENKVEEQVAPIRHKDEPFEVWLQKPVVLDATDDCSLLQLIVSADFDPDEGSTYVWKNVSVEIKTVAKP